MNLLSLVPADAVAVLHETLEVHEQARQVAGGLAAAGVGRGDAVAVLAGAPVEIAPIAQGIWMRGASLTMLHQPTPRTDLARWAADRRGGRVHSRLAVALAAAGLALAVLA